MIRAFNRYELKYVVPTSLLEELSLEVAAQMIPDREGSSAGVYRVTSLYYDTIDLQFYRSKVEGLKYRRKLRIRAYGEGTTAPVMVEIKQRMNRTTQKRRVSLPLSAAYTLCAGRLEQSFLDAADQRTAAEIEYLVRSLALRPRCVITYVRRAFMGSTYEPGLRLTFDHSLRCWDGSGGLDAVEHSYAFLPPDLMVLEVKANEHIPMWVSQMLARHRCGLGRFSKYCRGLQEVMSHVEGRFPTTGGFDGRAA